MAKTQKNSEAKRKVVFLARNLAAYKKFNFKVKKYIKNKAIRKKTHLKT